MDDLAILRRKVQLSALAAFKEAWPIVIEEDGLEGGLKLIAVFLHGGIMPAPAIFRLQRLESKLRRLTRYVDKIDIAAG